MPAPPPLLIAGIYLALFAKNFTNIIFILTTDLEGCGIIIVPML